MRLEPQLIPVNRHRKEGRLPCAIAAPFTWLDVIAVVCIGLPFLVIGLHLMVRL